MGDSSPIPQVKEGIRLEHFEVLHQQYRLSKELGLKITKQQNNSQSSQTYEQPKTVQKLKKKITLKYFFFYIIFHKHHMIW